MINSKIPNNLHIEQFKGGHIHFIGIGGISMSGLAEILLLNGYKISGSDMKDSPIIHRLTAQGADIHIGHNTSNVSGADLIIYTAAINDSNPEIIEAYKKNIPIMDRATLLGQIMQTYEYAIGVSGTHGKTTTTSMLSVIMEQAKLDPTILVGGELDAIGGNVRTGKSKYFVTEACEYVESFLKFHPYMAIILNIDQDHLDYFRDLDHIYEAFTKFAHLVPKNGYVIGCKDDALVNKLMNEVSCNVISYGIDSDSDWKAYDITYDANGCASFKTAYKGKEMGSISLGIPGRHNIYNALAACTAAWTMGVQMQVISSALASYSGTHRRFEIKGKVNGITVIDDYAHHPTEISATLDTLHNYTHNNTWCVFQPHTYTRTKKLFQKFIDAFENVDNLIITDIYAAREKDNGEIHSKDIVRVLSEHGGKVAYISSFDEIVDYLVEHAKPGDVVITIGAGNVNEIGEKFINAKTNMKNDKIISLTI